MPIKTSGWPMVRVVMGSGAVPTEVTGTGPQSGRLAAALCIGVEVSCGSEPHQLGTQARRCRRIPRLQAPGRNHAREQAPNSLYSLLQPLSHSSQSLIRTRLDHESCDVKHSRRNFEPKLPSPLLLSSSPSIPFDAYPLAGMGCVLAAGWYHHLNRSSITSRE